MEIGKDVVFGKKQIDSPQYETDNGYYRVLISNLHVKENLATTLQD